MNELIAELIADDYNKFIRIKYFKLDCILKCIKNAGQSTCQLIY